MGFNIDEVGSFIKQRLETYQGRPQVYDYGEVLYTADGMVQIGGLSRCRFGEILEFKNDVYGIALDLRIDGVGAVLLNGAERVRVGSVVRGTQRVVETPVGETLLGRVVDPLGRPLDGKPLNARQFRPAECAAPPIIDRRNIHQALETGLLAVDSMIPIGRGQRQLIIGDRQTGKSTIAVDAIINQRGKGVLCVYAAIGQKASTVAGVIRTLEDAGAMAHTVVVVSTASELPAMQYLAPYSACSVAEEFMYSGKDTLIVYDDLSKHAVAYRTMSLLLRRPPGREAYPGDVFYLHSRLLERAAKLSDALGGGSMTALPIVETMAGDISAYIPTNIISITDGQIFLEGELFHSGIRPAINVGLSVSRVGRAAQHEAMKKVSSSLRITLAQYREMSVFAQFSSDVDHATKQQLARGERLTEILKQNQGEPLPLSSQVALLLAFSGGVFKDLSLKDMPAFRTGLLHFLNSDCAHVLSDIDDTGDLSDETQRSLKAAMNRYAKKASACKT